MNFHLTPKLLKYKGKKVLGEPLSRGRSLTKLALFDNLGRFSYMLLSCLWLFQNIITEHSLTQGCSKWYWCLCWYIRGLNLEHPCSITSHRITNHCTTLRYLARIGAGFDILGSLHCTYTTTLHKLANPCKSLQIFAEACKSLHKLAKHCTTLHNLARIGAGVDILGGSPAIHRIDCAASGSLRLLLHFLHDHNSWLLICW